MMKQFLVPFCTVFFLYTANAQISVKVKKTATGGDLDIKTAGKPGSSKDGDSKPAPTETKTATTEVPVTNPTDTVSKPGGTAKFDENYAGPAKVQLKSMWRYLDKLRSGTYLVTDIANAERMLKQVKANDPAYNTTELENELSTYRQKADKESQSKNDAKSKAESASQYYNNVWQKVIMVYSRGNMIDASGKEYYDLVQSINLAEYQQKKKTAAGEGGAFVKKIDEALADYDNYLKRSDRLRWNVTELMAKARNEPNPQTKINMLQQAKYECEAVLLLSPENPAFNQKRDDVNKLLGNADAEASKYYTSDFHKQNVGKIIWSNKPLVIGKEKEMAANIKSEFKSGESVFGTIYLGNKASQLLNGNDRIRVIIKVDKGTAVWGGDLSNIIIPLAVQDKSYIQFALLPDEAWFSNNYAPYISMENWTYSYLMDQLANAGDISHEITCEFEFPTNFQSDIEGSLTLDLNDGSTNIKALAAKLHDQLMASRTLPKAGMNNAVMEQQMIAAANGLGWKNTFLKAIITSSSWAIKKNDLTGAVLYRYVDAVCTTKEYDGKCYYQEFSFRQDYTGSGYSNTIKYNGYGSKKEIGCDKIKN